MLKALFLASRPKTLIAGLCPVLIGASFAFYESGRFEGSYFALILTASVLIQIATNFFNDALDGESGKDTKKRLGPDRMAARGSLSSKALKTAGTVLLALSFVIGAFLFLKAGPLVLLVGIPALFLAYLYTGTDFSLSANGIADFFVITYFGVIPVWMTCYILSGEHLIEAVVSGFQIGLFANALLLINNLRDEAEDLSTDKKTLVVRFGRNFGLCFLAICLFLPYLLNIYFMKTIFFRAGLWAFLSFPFSVFIYVKVFKMKPSKDYNKYLGLKALHLVLFTFFFCRGVLSS